MSFKEFAIHPQQAISFKLMKQIDYHAIKNYDLPIELMMENAGYHLAKLCAASVRQTDKILIGVGKGHNGGGGLVAARRLLAWGYRVYIDVLEEMLSDLTAQQFNRAVAFGAMVKTIDNPDLVVDAYFGFSQRLPLPEVYIKRIKQLNRSKAPIISLDVPTGLPENPEENHPFIQADTVVSLAYPKKVLFNRNLNAKILLVDIGIPAVAFEDFGISYPFPFDADGILQLKVNQLIAD